MHCFNAPKKGAYKQSKHSLACRRGFNGATAPEARRFSPPKTFPGRRRQTQKMRRPNMRKTLKQFFSWPAIKASRFQFATILEYISFARPHMRRRIAPARPALFLSCPRTQSGVPPSGYASLRARIVSASISTTEPCLASGDFISTRLHGPSICGAA